MILKKGFTIVEMVLVLALLSIVILMSKGLFTDPNKDIINSEVCINKISGELNNFFYNAITGKKFAINTDSPSQYIISIGSKKDDASINNIVLNTDGSGGVKTIFSRQRSPSSVGENNCSTNSFIVLLSGEYNTPTSLNTGTITINSNLISSTDLPGGMKICYNGTCSSTFKLEYRVCPKSGNTAVMNKCIHTYTNFFDMRTQSIKNNKCISASKARNTCTSRSVDGNF